jgi:Uri superfamily endonuclease
MNSGSYRLYIKVSRKTTVHVGALGKLIFPKGIYVYTGSAMKNLRQRIERHKSKEKKIRWHIDYLLDSPNAKIIKIDTIESVTKDECKLNMELINNGMAIIPAKGFGSSDCNVCPAHLVLLDVGKFI